MEHFGERLKKIREKRCLTQLQAAQEVGRVGYLVRSKAKDFSKYECNFVRPNVYKLHDICIALNVSADYLLGLSDKEDLK